jgi:hypothetical protein
MEFVRRLSLVTLLLAFLPFGTAASASTIEDFSGRWLGKGITENRGNLFADRDLDVVIEPTDRGFTIVWKTSRTTKKNGVAKVGLWSITVPFVETDRTGIYRGEISSDPVSGSPYMWAHLDGRVLVVNSIAISDQGVLEQQRYERILSADNEMELRYTRSLDNDIVSSVLAILNRE